ncbi:hypothetical protein K402DRAFT_453852 [Aulographum hederae CBS 113979]|uniref:Uncharacterized protein n=1 Tax=Aulographum hederae CBS 113979 TaxID=1176131 RepID=A0A6G1H1M9_9PEZI|nr:hypothetical protein K402DRAFT_453852 [Aulographum hederae CBS 113979]
MSNPLSPLSSKALNARTPDTALRFGSKSPIMSAVSAKVADVNKNNDDDTINWDEGASSPFVTELEQENATGKTSPVEQTPSRIQSPSKHALLDHTEEILLATPSLQTDKSRKFFDIHEDEPELDATPRVPSKKTSPAKSPKKTPVMEQIKMSPSKTSDKSSRNNSPVPTLDTENAPSLRDNEGLTITMKTMEENKNNYTTHHTVVEETDYFETEATSMTLAEDANIDDTCFSTFSEILNTDMTTFARLGQRSPTKNIFEQTPRMNPMVTPGTARRHQQSSPRSPSPTPRRPHTSASAKDDDTFLIDFTQQFESFSTSSTHSPGRGARASSPTKSRTESNLLSYMNNQRSPTKQTPLAKKTILNLLDFELPPAPTPRSIPSITIRELESLKSSYLSQISSLKATLSGREAEVDSLKKAVGDAERRVGEAQEMVRDERSKREHAEKEVDGWEKRDREFEQVLNTVKKEIIESEREKEELAERLKDAEKGREEAEQRASDAEARAAEAASKVVTAIPNDAGVSSADSMASSSQNGDQKGLYTAEQVQKQIDEKVHTLSTELHAIYKKKHVTKVAGLKKGFEAKTKERVAELEQRLEDLSRINEELRTVKDATLSGPITLPASAQDAAETKTKLESQAAQLEELKAKLAGLVQELQTMRAQQQGLLQELERERVEKGELVAAVDEMLLLQQDESTAAGAIEDFRKSVRGAGAGMPQVSGLVQPRKVGLGGQSRIAAPAGLNRSVSGGQSRIMSKIERMGGRNVEG